MKDVDRLQEVGRLEGVVTRFAEDLQQGILTAKQAG